MEAGLCLCRPPAPRPHFPACLPWHPGAQGGAGRGSVPGTEHRARARAGLGPAGHLGSSEHTEASFWPLSHCFSKATSRDEASGPGNGGGREAGVELRKFNLLHDKTLCLCRISGTVRPAPTFRNHRVVSICLCRTLQEPQAIWSPTCLLGGPGWETSLHSFHALAQRLPPARLRRGRTRGPGVRKRTETEGSGADGGIEPCRAPLGSRDLGPTQGSLSVGFKEGRE